LNVAHSKVKVQKRGGRICLFCFLGSAVVRAEPQTASDDIGQVLAVRGHVENDGNHANVRVAVGQVEAKGLFFFGPVLLFLLPTLIACADAHRSGT
jgi:hypothetical protein